MYFKSIFEINYQKLKDMNIKCLIFDLDNTLVLIDQDKCKDSVRLLINDLKNDFDVYIVSNSKSSRVNPFLEDLEIDGVSLSLKPSTKAYKKILKKYNYKKNEMVMIGDQLVTDIFSGNKFGIYTILVDSLGIKDLKITKFNRIIERIILKKYSRKGIFERGRYYE